MFDKSITHPACEMVRASRVSSSGGKTLIGSDLKHRDTITLTIASGYKKRELNQDWYFADKDLIEIEMSYSQWGQFICSMNVGSGIPCTIRYCDGKRVENPPEPDAPVEVFDEEMQKNLSEARAAAQNAVVSAKELLSKQTVGKRDREELIKLFEQLAGSISQATPFIERQFKEKMEHVVTDAKAEVEAYVNNKLIDLGIKGLGSGMQSPLALDGDR